MEYRKAIAVLGGGMIRNKDGSWRTTNYHEGDNFGALGDRMRVLAAYYLYKKNPGFIIIALGGRGQVKSVKGVPPLSSVIKEELEKLGVLKSDILVESESGNTFEQLRALCKIINELGLKETIIISNRYHVVRIMAMLEEVDELKLVARELKIYVKEAESIVIEHDPEISKEIEGVYNSRAMHERIAAEAKGVEDLRKGKYVF